MTVRPAFYLLVLSGLLAPPLYAQVSRLDAVRAEIEVGKQQLVSKLALLREREQAGDVAGAEALRREIEAGKQVLLPKYVELAELERAQSATPAAPMVAPVVAPAPAPAPAPAAAPAPRPEAAPAASISAAAATSAMAAPRVDPAPYLAAAVGRLSAIRVSVPPQWLVIDEARVVIWTTSDEAYLLGVQTPCPILLSGAKLKLEDFSTRVRVGEEAVKVGTQRCLIESITRLGGRGLPKPPRR